MAPSHMRGEPVYTDKKPAKAGRQIKAVGVLQIPESVKKIPVAVANPFKQRTPLHHPILQLTQHPIHEHP